MAHEQPEYQIILLNGVRYPVSPIVGYNQTATFEPKRTDGDYTRDSDQIISAKIWTDFTGGIGVENHREGADEGRYWFGTLYVERPYQTCLPPKVYEYSGANWVLGDVDEDFYGQADDGSLMVWDEPNLQWDDTTANIDADPVFRAVAWNGKLYIPHGSGGYTTFTPPTTETISTTRLPIDFVAWDNRLFALCSDGKLSYTSNGTDWTDVATLDTSITPKKLSIYFDRSDNEVIMLTTNVGLFTYDPTSSSFRRSRFRLPPHPDNGKGVAEWRPGEDLFVSAGLQVYRYTGPAAVPMGPDRSEGVPPQYRGAFIDLISEHNAMHGFLFGVNTSGVESEPEVVFDEGLGAEDPFTISETTALSSIFAWTGSGWQHRWTSADDGGTPTWLAVSGLEAAYRLWWGYGTDTTYTIPLSRSFANARQRWITGEIDFEEAGYLDTGWIDHNMREFDKIASHIEINMDNASATELVRISYRIDFEESWTELATVTTLGKTIVPFNVVVQDDGTDFSVGLPYRRIRFKLEMERGADASQSPFMDSFSLKYIKVPVKSAYFTVTIPLQSIDGFEGRTNDEIRHEIEDLLVDDGFIRLEYGADEHRPSRRVRLSRFNAPVRTGLNSLANITMTAIEVPVEGYDGNHPDAN